MLRPAQSSFAVSRQATNICPGSPPPDHAQPAGEMRDSLPVGAVLVGLLEPKVLAAGRGGRCLFGRGVVRLGLLCRLAGLAHWLICSVSHLKCSAGVSTWSTRYGEDDCDHWGAGAVSRLGLNWVCFPGLRKCHFFIILCKYTLCINFTLRQIGFDWV